MLDLVVPLFAIMAGCCSNVITLEMIMKSDSGSGDLITFSQFVFVAFEGLFFHLELTNSTNSTKPAQSITVQAKHGKAIKGKKGKGGEREEIKGEKEIEGKKVHTPRRGWFPIRLKPRKIPIPYYMVMVLIFFLVSVLNNKALGYKISLPFHMIFRSASLLANMLLGILIFKKRYSWQQISSVLLLTLGVFMATAASASQIQKKKVEEEATDMTQWLMGVAMLLAALLLSSLLGLYQEWTYSIYGKENYRESMFYSHILALPFFGLFYNEIYTHALNYNSSPSWTLPLLNFTLPSLWWNLIINVITQGVFTLGGRTGSSLTSTLAISVRKFVSLVVVYFGNPFSALHWFSTGLVFAGTILYTFAPKPDAITKKLKSKQQ